MGKSIIIVGAGLAGLKAAEALRSAGHQGSIKLALYHRPPLPKGFLQGP